MVRVQAKQQIIVHGKWVLPGEKLVVSEAVYRQILQDYPDSLQSLEPLREVLGAEPITEEPKTPPVTPNKKRVVSNEPKSS